jgi:hypothetical protein
MQRKVFFRHKTLGMIPRKSPASEIEAGLDHSSQLNVSLTGCSSAEPVFNSTKFKVVFYIYNLSKFSAIYQLDFI